MATTSRARSPQASARKGKLLLCCATALSDVEVEYEEGAAVREQPFGVYAARIERLDRIAHDVMLVALRLVGGKRIVFEAGQYINIILPDGDRRAYSFTTPSGETDLVELHVRRMPGGQVHHAPLRAHEGRRPGALRGPDRRVHPARAERAAADLRRRGDRLRAGEEPARAGVPDGHHAPAPLLLGRAQAARPLLRRAAGALAAGAPELQVRAGALGGGARGRVDRPHRVRPRGDPRRLPGPRRGSRSMRAAR